MPLTNAGRDFIAQAIMNDSPTFFNNANAHLGVGDSSTAFSASQTDLQATTNNARKGMDPGYPTRSGNVLTFKSTFGTEEGNFTWNEWGVFNALSGGVMLSRKVESMGTKSSGSVWVFEVDITIGIGS